VLHAGSIRSDDDEWFEDDDDDMLVDEADDFAPVSLE